MAEALARVASRRSERDRSNDNRAARGIHSARSEDLGSSPVASHDLIPRTEVQLARLSDVSQGTE
jgi:hypothetical protein